MSDERDRPREGGANASKRPISRLGVAAAGVAALVFVGGTLLSIMSASDETPEEEPRPTLAALLEDTDLVVRAEATSLERLGQSRDAGVLARIAVEEVIAPTEGPEAKDISIYDEGFRETWSEGQRMLLFLAEEEPLPEGAGHRVVERCVLEEGALPCPYHESDIARLSAP